MLLQFHDGETFATGAVPYVYRPATARERFPRIHLDIRIGMVEGFGFIDTGGVFLLCSPDIAASLQLFPANALAHEKILWRGNVISGTLHRVAMTLSAEQGADLVVEVTAFVPRLSNTETWSDDLPLVLGMHGCLEFVRFAIDPSDDTFYFGPLGEIV